MSAIVVVVDRISVAAIRTCRSLSGEHLTYQASQDSEVIYYIDCEDIGASSLI
jgi:hypothetical protein